MDEPTSDPQVQAAIAALATAFGPWLGNTWPSDIPLHLERLVAELYIANITGHNLEECSVVVAALTN